MPPNDQDATTPWHKKLRDHVNSRAMDLFRAREPYFNGRISVNLAWLFTIIGVLIILAIMGFVLLPR